MKSRVGDLYVTDIAERFLTGLEQKKSWCIYSVFQPVHFSKENKQYLLSVLILCWMDGLARTRSGWTVNRSEINTKNQ